MLLQLQALYEEGPSNIALQLLMQLGRETNMDEDDLVQVIMHLPIHIYILIYTYLYKYKYKYKY